MARDAYRAPRVIVGVALAGGQSRRMGRDKALMPSPGASQLTMVEWAVRRLGQVCDDVLVADGGRGLLEGHRSVEDGPGRGPAAGLLGAAFAAPGHRLLALACDLPRVPVSVLHVLREIEGDWVVPISPEGQFEPLCSIYSPRALERLAQRVKRGLWAPRGIAEEPDLEIRRLGPEQWPEAGGSGGTEPEPVDFFANVNTPEDYERLAAARRLRPGQTSR